MSEEEILERARRVIDREIEGIRKLRDALDSRFAKAVELILGCDGKVIVTGIGKSGHIARKVASTLASTGTPAHYLHPSEALHGDLGVIDSKDVVIAISSSGESREVVEIIPYLKMLGVPLIVECEACPLQLAPTTTSTATLVLGDAIAMTLLEIRGFTAEDFALRHPAGTLGRKLRLVRDLYHTGDELPLVREEDPMREVILEMTSKGFIITDGDLRRFVRRGGDFDRSSARDVMTRNPKTAKPEEMAMEALRRMEEHKITVLIVTDGDRKPIGIIHLHDILRAEINL